jgi:hypothetical protein
MGLQIDIVQDAANRCRANCWDDPVSHRLAGQVLTGPVGDVQPLGDWLQTGQFNDLGPLHGGNLLLTAGVALPAVGEQEGQATLPITLAGSPNRGLVTFEPGSDRALPLPSSDSQDDLGALHLKPGQGTTLGRDMQSSLIPSSDLQLRGSASTHEATSLAGLALPSAYRVARIHCKFCDQRH